MKNFIALTIIFTDENNYFYYVFHVNDISVKM